MITNTKHTDSQYFYPNEMKGVFVCIFQCQDWKKYLKNPSGTVLTLIKNFCWIAFNMAGIDEKYYF